MAASHRSSPHPSHLPHPKNGPPTLRHLHPLLIPRPRMPTTCSTLPLRPSPMAPALTSNSFRFLSAPPRPRPTVICRFGVGKPKGSASANNETKKTKPFFVDFGKLPDAKSLIPALPTSSAGSLFAGGRGRKDPRTVFVAGATGQAGARITQTLLRQGFAVRAGVPDLTSAQELARLAAAYRVISPAEARQLNAVESVFGDPESIAKSIGPAGKVVVTIGPAEKGPEGGVVTTDDALRVVRAADLAGVAHVVVVYDDRVGSGSSSYNVLDGFTSFFSNLFSRTQTLSLREFLAKVVATDIRYTLVKASLTEDYSPESSYGLVVTKEGASRDTSTTDSGKVSKWQIATFVADVFSNVTVAENKVVELSTSSSATSKPIVQALAAIPEDSRRMEYQEAVAKAKAEEEALAAQRTLEAEEAAKKLQAKGKKRPSEETTASAVTEVREWTEASLENLLSRAKGLSGDFSWDKFSSQLAGAAARNSNGEEPKAQIATVRGQAKAKKLMPQRAVVKQPAQKVKPKPTQPEATPVFGGLFKQETFYMDED